MWRDYKRLLIVGIMIIMLLSGCNQFTKQSRPKNELTVLTVEFNSGAPIPNLYIKLTDVESGKKIEEAMGSDEGEATFTNLVEGREYTITATTLNNVGDNDGYTTIEKFTYDVTKPYYRLPAHSSRAEQELAVPVIMQKPELPQGCEITSLTAILNYYGMDVTKLEMADTYLPKQNIYTAGGQRYGPNPAVAYAGNPRDKANGMYVFAAPIVKAAEAVIADKQSNLRVTNMSGASQSDILELVEEGVPVVVWVTLDLSTPKTTGNKGWIYEGETLKRDAYINLHAVVLTGYSNKQVVVMDPLQGNVSYNVDEFFKSYQELNMQAVAVHK
ncbi:C39 family peptidase [Lysinibacillus mangiferihumi]|nr:C39 family peptidase [Lysinibacillus mangiferihumi]